MIKSYKLAIYILFIYTICNSSVMAYTQAEIDGRNNGRLEISVVEINGETADTNPPNADDSPFFSRALHIYKDSFIPNTTDKKINGYIVLSEGQKYRITRSIFIENQRGLTIQGRGEGNSRSTILLDFDAGSESNSGIIIDHSFYFSLRKVKIESTSSHTGNAIYIFDSYKTEIHDVEFLNIYNGVRHARTNTLTLSKITMINPRGLYGFLGVGLQGQATCCIDIIDFKGISSNNNQLEWIKMSQYSATLILYNINLTGGARGFVMGSIDNNLLYTSAVPKYIVGLDIKIANTLQEGIKINSGHELQMSRVTIENAGADGIRIEPTFTGSFLLSEPRITGSSKHGIYVATGDQVHIYNPEIGYNSTSIPNYYSGIYFATHTQGFSVNYGVIGDFNATNDNQQKYGIELAGIKGVDNTHFSIVDVQDIGNQLTQISSVDPNGGWFYIVRPDRITNIPKNSALLDVSKLVSLSKEYPENVTLVNPGSNNIQSAVDMLCSTGGVIWLKPGRHSITNSLKIDSCHNIKIVQAGNPYFSDIFFTQNHSNIIIKNSSNIVFSDFFTKSYDTHNDYAVQILDSSNISFINGVFVNTGKGIKIISSDNTKILNTQFVRVGDKAIVLEGSENKPTTSTIIFMLGYRDKSITNVGQGTGTAIVINSYTDNTQIYEGIGLNSGKTLVIQGMTDSHGQLVHPTNIIGHQVVTDHNSKEGIIIKAGKNIEFTNLWMGANTDYRCETNYQGPLSCDPSPHILILNGENIKFFNTFVRFAGGHGIHIKGGKNISLINTTIGWNGIYGTSGTCNYDGVRVESAVDGFTMRGGTSGNVLRKYRENLDLPSWEKQRRGLTLLTQSSSLIKGIDFHDNCWNPSTYGAPSVQQYNPGW